MLTPLSSQAEARAVHALSRLKLSLLDPSRAASHFSAAPTAELELRLLLLVASHTSGISPSELVAQARERRSTAARGMSRLVSQGLVVRSQQVLDHRRVTLRASGAGLGRLRRFESAMAEALKDNREPLKDVLRLLGGGRDKGTTRPVPFRDAIQAWSLVAFELANDASDQLAAFGLAAATDRSALLVIADAGESRPSVVARQLGLSSSGSTSLINRLVGSGLVVREGGPLGDGRGVAVRLTARGRGAVSAYMTVFQRHREDVLEALASLDGATLE